MVSAKASTQKALEREILSFLATKGILAETASLETPGLVSNGDLTTTIALKHAASLKSAPVALAEEIAEYLRTVSVPGIARIEVKHPGFINFFLQNTVLEDTVKEIHTHGDQFGRNNDLADEKWIVEHTSPNPNKAMHLGHLRINLIGMSLVHLLAWCGADVKSDAVDNNRGIAIAKLMWGFLAHMRKSDEVPVDIARWSQSPQDWYTPDDLEMLPDLFVTKCYLLGEKDFKSSSETEVAIRNLVVAWEEKDELTWKLWSHVLSYAYQGMHRTLDRLGSHWDKIWHEHEHYQQGKDFVRQGIEQGIFTVLEDGAVLTDLHTYNIPDTILLKRDGTSLYITQDIALTALKKRTYNADKLVWIIGPEQSLAMKQLFAVCEQLGIGKLSDFTHLSYGYVGLKDANGEFKKMSSREGTVVLIDDVIDVARDKVLSQLETKPGQTEGKEALVPLAEKIALAAVKFSILKSDRNQNLSFDVDESIEIRGDSGVYVLYTYVRIKSISRKKSGAQTPTEIRIHTEEQRNLARALSLFPDVVRKSGKELSTHHIAQYLLEVCSLFNAWYAKETIIDGSEDEDSKIALALAASIILKNGLSILGIATVEEM
jgi:arginyl-tRNA synthetase